MRHMQRPNVLIPTLEKMMDWKNGKTPKGKWRDEWNKPDVRGALFAMHGPVCSYCLSRFDRDRGDVEHFRPKSSYPWLAFRFDNYLLSCLTCNRIFKRGKFPLTRGSTQIAEGDPVGPEPRLLLDPVEDVAIEGWLCVDLREKYLPLKSASPNPTSIESQRVSETVDFFSLNLERTLINMRRQAVREAKDVFRKARKNELSDQERMYFWRSASRREPHGMIRRLVILQLDASGTIARQLLPTKREEMELWLASLIEMLTDENQLLGKANAEPARIRLRAKCTEFFWALATVWKAPAPLTAGEVEAEIKKSGFVGDIRPLFDQL